MGFYIWWFRFNWYLKGQLKAAGLSRDDIVNVLANLKSFKKRIKANYIRMQKPRTDHDLAETVDQALENAYLSQSQRTLGSAHPGLMLRIYKKVEEMVPRIEPVDKIVLPDDL